MRAGAGWGVVDALGRPKAPWFALARSLQPVGVLVTDEGLNGLALHLVNDTADDLAGRVEVGAYSADHRLDGGSGAVVVPARGGVRVAAEDLLDGFRDLTYAYRFGPRTTELVVARLVGEDGALLGTATFLPDGPGRPVQAEVGLQAVLHQVDEQAWSLSVSTAPVRPVRLGRRTRVPALGLVVPPRAGWDGDGRPPSGGPRGRPPKGQVRALNTVEVARISA